MDRDQGKDESQKDGCTSIGLARPAGIEPATLGLEGRCSIRLSYGRPLGKSHSGGAPVNGPGHTVFSRRAVSFPPPRSGHPLASRQRSFHRLDRTGYPRLVDTIFMCAAWRSLGNPLNSISLGKTQPVVGFQLGRFTHPSARCMAPATQERNQYTRLEMSRSW